MEKNKAAEGHHLHATGAKEEGGGMNDYIKREDAVILLKGLNGYCIMQSGHPNEQIKVAIKTIKSLPAEDVVNVVRCKDCKHWTKFPNLQQDGQCHHFDLFVEDKFYCADGERR